MRKEALLIFIAIIGILFISFPNIVEAKAVCAPWGPCINVNSPTLSGSPSNLKTGSTCAKSIPEGLVEKPCSSGNPNFFSTCNGITKCYYENKELTTENTATSSDSPGSSKSSGIAEDSLSSTSSHWLWNIGKWPKLFVSAFSSGWHSLTNLFFSFSDIK